MLGSQIASSVATLFISPCLFLPRRFMQCRLPVLSPTSEWLAFVDNLDMGDFFLLLTCDRMTLLGIVCFSRQSGGIHYHQHEAITSPLFYLEKAIGRHQALLTPADQRRGGNIHHRGFVYVPRVRWNNKHLTVTPYWHHSPTLSNS